MVTQTQQEAEKIAEKSGAPPPPLPPPKEGALSANPITSKDEITFLKDIGN